MENQLCFVKKLALKVIDALSHWFKNLLHHRARFFGYIGNPQLVGKSQSGVLSHLMLMMPFHYLNLQPHIALSSLVENHLKLALVQVIKFKCVKTGVFISVIKVITIFP